MPITHLCVKIHVYLLFCFWLQHIPPLLKSSLVRTTSGKEAFIGCAMFPMLASWLVLWHCGKIYLSKHFMLIDQLSQKQTLFLCPVGFPCSFLLHCCSLVCGRFESQPTLLLIGRSAITEIDESWAILPLIMLKCWKCKNDQHGN